MSTATAIQPREPGAKILQVTIDLVLARPEDLKENNKQLRVGMIYWLRSSITKQFEQWPLIITKDEDVQQLKEWFDHDMIYVAKNQFK